MGMPPSQSNEQSRKDALAAYYRLRSESLKDSHTVSEDRAKQLDAAIQEEVRKKNQEMQRRQNPQSLWDYIANAIGGALGS